MNIEVTLLLVFILIVAIFLLLMLHNQIAKEINNSESLVTPPSEKKRAGKSYKTFAIILLIAGAFTFGGYYITDAVCKSKDTPNPIIALFKKAPTITAEKKLENLLDVSILFTIYANDNYDQVIIKIKLYSSEKVEFKSYTLTGTNYRKGESYQLSQKFLTTDLIDGYYYNWKCTYYK